MSRRRKKKEVAKTVSATTKESDEAALTDVAFVPFGREIFFGHEVPENGDFYRDGQTDEIIFIFDGGTWHEVVQEHGEYLSTGYVCASVRQIIAEEAHIRSIPWVDRHRDPWDDFDDDTLATTTGKDKHRNQSSPVTDYKPTTYTHVSKPAGRVITKETGVAYTTNVKRYVEELSKVFEFTEAEDGVPTATIPINNLRFKKVQPSVQMCGYNGTDSYLKHWMGRELDSDDASWYRYHEGTDTDGLGLAWVPTALHQLVEPYGVGVCRIRLPLNRFFLFQDRNGWIASLGMNPLAMQDASMTNESFATAAGDSLDEVDGLFRVDYGDAPLAPSVTAFETSLATGGGHIEYLGPRGNGSGRPWAVSVQFDWLDRIHYYVPLQITEYKEKGKCYELVWDAIVDNEGKTVVPSLVSTVSRAATSGYSHRHEYTGPRTGYYDGRSQQYSIW
jgi:hypothetical protein